MLGDINCPADKDFTISNILTELLVKHTGFNSTKNGAKHSVACLTPEVLHVTLTETFVNTQNHKVDSKPKM